MELELGGGRWRERRWGGGEVVSVDPLEEVGVEEGGGGSGRFS